MKVNACYMLHLTFDLPKSAQFQGLQQVVINVLLQHVTSNREDDGGKAAQAAAPPPPSPPSDAPASSNMASGLNVSSCIRSSRIIVTSSPRACRSASSSERATLSTTLTSTSGCRRIFTSCRPS